MLRKSFKFILYASFAGIAMSCSIPTEPEPLYPIPSDKQMSWQEMEYYAFIHYSLNTYTNQSWGYGDEPLSLFDPDSLDCRQWARVCKEAGMKGIIFTAKHHCGFCMWPSEYTEYITTVSSIDACLRTLPMRRTRVLDAFAGIPRAEE